jgi:hypothetical protein
MLTLDTNIIISYLNAGNMVASTHLTGFDFNEGKKDKISF